MWYGLYDNRLCGEKAISVIVAQAVKKLIAQKWVKLVLVWFQFSKDIKYDDNEQLLMRRDEIYGNKNLCNPVIDKHTLYTFLLSQN